MAESLITIEPSAQTATALAEEPWLDPNGVPQVALVTMPFGYSKFPSIQLGTLSRVLKNHNIGSKSYHFNLLFAHRIGVPLYEVLCEKRGMIGEWLFSSILFRDNPKHTQYPNVFKPVFESTAQEAGCSTGYLEEIAHTIAPQFLTELLTSYDWGRFKVVGFTSTFDQNVASLTLAKLIKDLYPAVRIVFGGANFDGEMGLEHFRAFPWIDYVVVGEGEEVFPALVKHVLHGQEDVLPSGVAFRKDGEIRFQPNTTLFSDFSGVGPPDYDDYFDMVQELERVIFVNPIFNQDIMQVFHPAWFREMLKQIISSRSGLRVAEAGMNMHTSDEPTPYTLLKRVREPLVALLAGGRLLRPLRERMGRGGHDRGSVCLRGLKDQPASFAQGGAHLSQRVTDLGVGLDLGSEKFVYDFVRSPVALAGLENAGVRIGQQVARDGVYEKEFLLNAHREVVPGLIAAHVVPLFSNIPQTPYRL